MSLDMRRNIKYKTRDMNVKWRGHEHYLTKGSVKIMRKVIKAKYRIQMQKFLATGDEDELYPVTYGVGKSDAWRWD